MMEMESSQTTTTTTSVTSRRSSVDAAINQINQQYNRTNTSSTSSTHEHQNNTPWWQFNNRRASSVSEEEVEKAREVPATWWKMNRRTTGDTRATVETVNNGWWLKKNGISRSEDLDDSLVSDRHVDVSERSKEGGNSISSVVVEEKQLNDVQQQNNNPWWKIGGGGDRGRNRSKSEPSLKSHEEEPDEILVDDDKQDINEEHQIELDESSYNSQDNIAGEILVDFGSRQKSLHDSDNEEDEADKHVPQCKIDLGDTCSVSDSFEDEDQGQGITEDSQYDNYNEEQQQQKRSILSVDKFTNGIDDELDQNEKKCLSPQSPSEYDDIGDIINQQEMRYKSQDSLTPLSRNIIDKNKNKRKGKPKLVPTSAQELDNSDEQNELGFGHIATPTTPSKLLATPDKIPPSNDKEDETDRDIYAQLDSFEHSLNTELNDLEKLGIGTPTQDVPPLNDTYDDECASSVDGNEELKRSLENNLLPSYDDDAEKDDEDDNNNEVDSIKSEYSAYSREGEGYSFLDETTDGEVEEEYHEEMKEEEHYEIEEKAENEHHAMEGGVEEVHTNEIKDNETSPSTPKEHHNSVDSLQVGWNSSKLCEIKQGVSLAKSIMFDDDEVSSIASSEHSGRAPKTRRNGLMKSFSRRKSISSVGDTSKTSSNASMLKTSKQKMKASLRKSMINSYGALNKRMSRQSVSVRNMNKGRRGMGNINDKYTVSDIDSSGDAGTRLNKEQQDAMDAKHMTIVKEACELMSNVNKSTSTMGMDQPFRPVDELFPSMKKLHSNIGDQMSDLKAAIGNPKSISRRERKLNKTMKKSLKKSSLKSCADSVGGASFISKTSPIGSSLPPQINDHKALSAYIMDQMQYLQEQQKLLETSDIPSVATLYTSYLPNYMWYQPTAGSSPFKPTSLCSGTGISSGAQYLQPEMLSVFQVFGSYFVGSAHLFEDDDDEGEEDDSASKLKGSTNSNKFRRSTFWVEPIEEGMNEDSSYISAASSDDSFDSSSSKSDSDSSSSEQDTFDIQKQLVEQVIGDLRASQMQMSMMTKVESSKQSKMRDYKIKDKMNDRSERSASSNDFAYY